MAIIGFVTVCYYCILGRIIKKGSKSLVNNQRQAPIIYNLFPRIAGTMPDWLHHASRVVEMGFNWLHINLNPLPGVFWQPLGCKASLP